LWVETKNIPKNFCKAIINYALSNEKLCLKLLGNSEEKLQCFFLRLTLNKKTLTNIKQFSELVRNNVTDKKIKEINQVFRIIR
jgi:guanylate kinase